MKERKRGLRQVHAAVLLFGLAGLIGKVVLLPALLIVLGRVVFASITLIGIIRFSNRRFRLTSRRDIAPLVLLGLLLAVHWAAFFQSIKVSTVAVGMISYATFPVFAALIEPFLFDEKFRIRDLLPAFAAFLGAAVLVPALDIGNAITQGVFWGILSGLTFALLSVFNRKYVRTYSGLVIAFYEDTAAAVFLFPALLLLEFHIGLRDILLLVFLGVFSTAVAHSLFISGMRHVKARSASIIAALEPVYGILFALVILREIPSLRTVLGGILIVGAATFATALSEEEQPGLVAPNDDMGPAA